MAKFSNKDGGGPGAVADNSGVGDSELEWRNGQAASVEVFAFAEDTFKAKAFKKLGGVFLAELSAGGDRIASDGEMTSFEGDGANERFDHLRPEVTPRVEGTVEAGGLTFAATNDSENVTIVGVE